MTAYFLGISAILLLSQIIVYYYMYHISTRYDISIKICMQCVPYTYASQIYRQMTNIDWSVYPIGHAGERI